MDADLDHLRRKAPAPTAMITLGTFVVAAALVGCAPAENRGQSTSALSSDPNDAVVAITDPGGPIPYRKVRCPANLRASPEQCLKAEQERLRVRLTQLIIDDAAATNNLELTEDERADVEKHVVAEKQANADAARVFKGAISGAARVHAGEPLDEVAADVAKDGVSIDMLKGAMNEYPTEADARRASARDFIADGDTAVRTYSPAPGVVGEASRPDPSACSGRWYHRRGRSGGVLEGHCHEAPLPRGRSSLSVTRFQRNLENQ
jgi:hypothetical protein